MKDTYITEKEAALLLGVSPGTMRTWRHRSMVPDYIIIGKRSIRYKQEDILKLCKERKSIQVVRNSKRK